MRQARRPHPYPAASAPDLRQQTCVETLRRKLNAGEKRVGEKVSAETQNNVRRCSERRMKLPDFTEPWFWGTRLTYYFDNGYGASVVDKDDGAHSESGGFYKLTVLRLDGSHNSAYKAAIFDRLTDGDVADLLDKIEAVAPSGCGDPPDWRLLRQQVSEQPH